MSSALVLLFSILFFQLEDFPLTFLLRKFLLNSFRCGCLRNSFSVSLFFFFFLLWTGVVFLVGSFSLLCNILVYVVSVFSGLQSFSWKYQVVVLCELPCIYITSWFFSCCFQQSLFVLNFWQFDYSVLVWFTLNSLTWCPLGFLDLDVCFIPQVWNKIQIWFISIYFLLLSVFLLALQYFVFGLIDVT